jgi:phosphoribosyl-dephospho-CoA transferase
VEKPPDAVADVPHQAEKAPRAPSHAAGETAPPRDDLISQIMGALEGVDLNEQQKQDAERYLPKWSAHAQQSGWTATQQARFVRELRGREVLSITSAQATLAGGKIIYRSQLGA